MILSRLYLLAPPLRVRLHRLRVRDKSTCHQPTEITETDLETMPQLLRVPGDEVHPVRKVHSELPAQERELMSRQCPKVGLKHRYRVILA